MKDIFSIDIRHDFVDDYLKGRDPDGKSKLLCHWHKILWEKPLPYNKGFFVLEEKRNRYSYYYLYHNSNLGEYFLTSDAMINEYYDYPSKAQYKDMQIIISQFSEKDINAFIHKIVTIGGYLVFPGNKVNSLPTINQARGCNRKISDRFDLTLECIRLYYNNKINPSINPLGETIHRYKDFFDLFGDFMGYCDFFFLQDLVSDDYSKVNFFLPFDGFSHSDHHPKPKSVEEYNIFKNNCIDFISKRNNRIEQYIKGKNSVIKKT